MATRRSPPPAPRTRAPRRPAEASFPIVGIGASAGGLEAFGQLLSGLPADTGAAFVLVQHLDPSHDSILASLLSRMTAMPVSETTDGTRIEPDHVYVIPPAVDIELLDGHIHHVPRAPRREPHLPVDLFLRTLAEVRESQAIAVILSGTGTDGTQGCRDVKAHGGIALAQEPDSAKFAGMPQSAIGSHCIDLVMAPAAMGAEIARLTSGRYVRDAARASASERDRGGDGVPLARIFTLLENATAADFGCYKKTTLLRRIRRRMALHGVEDVPAYAAFLEGHPAELEELHRDLLINVTSFFRDPQTFEALQADVLPRLLRARRADAPIRVWVPGCATGEEAYTIAMCLLEVQGVLGQNAPVQVFASDLSEAAIKKARAGTYTESIEAHVSRERLLRFFTREAGRYQVSKAVRDLMVFAHHDLTRDPPFSRMDLVSCRNVLIYLEPALQKRVMATFHYALQPEGLLLLGQAETVGTASDAFTVVDREHKVYAKRPHATPGPLRSLPHPGRRAAKIPTAMPTPADRSADLVRESQRLLLDRYAPASVLVDEKDEVFHFRGDTEPYLGHAEGAASFRLTKLARRGLLPELRRLLEEARAKNAPRRKTGLLLRHRGRVRRVALEAVPLSGPSAAQRCFLVIFDDGGRRAPEPVARISRTASAEKRHMAHLEQELQALEENQRTAQQEHDAANEELQSANEEIVSSNEELQSINEEMETAKEELQSNNEELMTLNEELQTRNAELTRLHDDLDNFLTSSTIPVLMLSRDLVLRQVTPAAGSLLGVLPADVGRPLGRLGMRIDASQVEALVVDVLESMAPVERELQDGQGRWWRMHVRPYRTRDSRIDGAVLVLVDIDALKRNQEVVEAARDFADAVVEAAHEPLLVLDAALRVHRANAAFCEAFGVTREEAAGAVFHELVGGEWPVGDLRARLQDVLASGRSFDDFVMEEIPAGAGRTLVLNARRLRSEANREDLLLLAIEDRTEARRNDAARTDLLHQAEESARLADEANRLKDEFVATASHELRGPLSALLTWTHLMGQEPLDEQTRRRGLEAIERSARTQTRLIEDLLDVTRIALGKMRLEMMLLPLAPIVEAAIESARPAAEAKGVNLAMERGDSTELVLADAGRLQQVVWNLVSNAVKFTPKDGSVQVSCGRAGTFLHVAVKDDGQGIAPAFLPHVFERFRQADGSTSRAQPGLGLGLSIVRHLVELHGGTVSAESPGPGRGSTFVVTLPVPTLRAKVEQALSPLPEAVVSATRSARIPSLGGVDVLIVDDDTDGREAVRTVLEQRGATVRSASSVVEALEAFAAAPPDVLVSDIGMPLRDGYDLIRDVRSRARDRGGAVPALALTAYAASEDRQRTAAAGFQDYLAKPAEPAELVWRVARLAGRAEAD